MSKKNNKPFVFFLILNLVFSTLLADSASVSYVAERAGRGRVPSHAAGEAAEAYVEPETAAASPKVAAIVKTKPAVNWAAPAGITYGDALSEAQLNATASVPGTFAYSPDFGTLLNTGNRQKLSVTFTPDDTAGYAAVTKTVNINVAQRPITIAADPQTKGQGEADPTLTYSVTAGSLAGSDSFTGSLTRASGERPGNYAIRQGTLKIDDGNRGANYKLTFVGSSLTIVSKATPAVNWATPAGITYGDALSEAQLNATANVPGTFAYTPALGTMLNAGNEQVLKATFTPADTATYNSMEKTVLINVAPKPATIKVDDKTKIFGQSDPVFTGVITGLVAEGDLGEVTYFRSNAEINEIGAYPDVLDAKYTENPNYVVTVDKGDFTITAAPAEIATLMFTFDDGWKDNATYAAPILSAAGYKGTIYVNRSTIEWPAYPELMISIGELDNLYNDGWDISNHTINHKDFERDLYGLAFEISKYPAYKDYGANYIEFSSRTDQYAQDELRFYYKDNQDWIEGHGWAKGARHAAYPSGLWSEALIETLKDIGVLTARLADYGSGSFSGGQPIADYYKIPTQYVETEFPSDPDRGDNMTATKAAIDKAIATKTPLTLMLHRVMPNKVNNYPAFYPGDALDDLIVTTADLQEIVNYVQSKETSGLLNVATVSEWYNSQPNSKITGASISGVSSLPVEATDWMTASIAGGNKGITVAWSSSNSGVATVDNLGRVTGKSTGSATITATVSDVYGTVKTASRSVTVTNTINIVSARPVIPELRINAGDAGIDMARILQALHPAFWYQDVGIDVPVALLKTSAGKEIYAPVTWDDFTTPAFDVTKPGTYILKGTIAPPAGYAASGVIKAELKIIVPGPLNIPKARSSQLDDEPQLLVYMGVLEEEASLIENTQ